MREKYAHIETNGVKIKLRMKDSLWALPMHPKNEVIATLRMQIGGKPNARTWHKRLGHIGDKKLKQMIKSGIISNEASEYTALDCETCKLTHPKRRPIPSIADRSGRIAVQVDYVPTGQNEIGWKNEVGAYVYSSRQSKLMKAYPVTNASAESAALTLNKYFKNIVPMLREQIDCIQTDAGTQFNSNEWKTMCAENKVMHRTCPVDCQAMNGQVERAIGILMAKTRALLMDKSMDKKYWPLVLEAATYLLNRTPHESLGGLTPLQKSTGQRPDLRKARVFGCRAYVQILKTLRNGKLGDTAWAGVMVGYSTQSPEWITLDTNSGRLRNAHLVNFDENTSGFTTAENDMNTHPVVFNEKERGCETPSNEIHKVMLDYEDFNSTHSLDAQKIVVSELFKGLAEPWLEWLTGSFDNMHVQQLDGTWATVTGTLMLGHRMTSIINTILNAAYIRLELGDSLYNACRFYHVGDDVLATCDEPEVAHAVLSKATQSQLRFQRHKQGFGTYCAEFLRLCFNDSVAVGYLSRSIASAVSGSWTSDILLGRAEYTATVCRNVWNMCNHALLDTRPSMLLCTTAVHRIGLSYEMALAVCTG